MKAFTIFVSFVLPAVWCATAIAATPTTAEPIRLDELVAAIVEHNPELAFYAAEVEAARANQRTAATREDPELTLELGRKRVREPGGVLAGAGTVWSVSISQTFEWPGRIALRKAIANCDLALAELGLARFKAALAARAQTLAYGLFAAQERAAAIADVAARYQALRELFLARDPGGITPLLETRVIEAQELVLQHDATEAELALDAALLELNRLRGMPPDTAIRVAPVKFSFRPPPELDALLAAARENNFELRAAQLELEQQGLAVSLARHEQRPAITLSPYYAEENAAETERTFGLGLSLPLPVSGRGSAHVATAAARQRQAEAAWLVAQRTMENDVTLAARTFAAKVADVARWSPEAAQRFRDAAELADRHFRLGAVPISTYVELQNSYLEAIDALYTTQQEALEAGGRLQVMTGLEFTPVETPQ